LCGGVISGEDNGAEKAPGSVRSVERAADILMCLGNNEKSLTEISMEVGLSKATAYRILGALQKKNFVARDEESGFA